MFSSLIGNAVQHGFTDAPIIITVEGLEREVVVSVHTQGVPIPPEQIGAIFSALTRSEPHSDDESGHGPLSVNLGLGFNISREIVIAHDGSITIISTEKDGTTFSARFLR